MNRTFRVSYTTYTTRHHGGIHSLHFKRRQTADRFTKLLDRGIRFGIIGGYIMTEIVH